MSDATTRERSPAAAGPDNGKPDGWGAAAIERAKIVGAKVDLKYQNVVKMNSQNEHYHETQIVREAVLAALVDVSGYPRPIRK